jgi:tetratricopeptide (TPR) repeat protein
MQWRLAIALVLLVFASCKNKQSLGANDEKKLTPDQDFRFNQYFVEAKRYQILRQNDKAKSLFESALKIDNSCSTCYYEMAVMADEANQVADALRLLKKALKYDSENKWILHFYAELTREQKMYKESTIAYEKLIQIEPTEIQHYYDLAQAYIESNQYEKAIDVYNKAEQKSGIKAETSIQKHSLYARLGKVNEAIEELQKLIAHFPTDTKFLITLADYYHFLKRDDEAVTIYEEAVKVNGCLYQARLSLYDYYRTKNERRKSFDELGKAFACKEMGIDSKVEILLKYYSISKNDSSLSKEVYSLLTIVNQTHPNEGKAITLLGDYYYRDNLLDKALIQYKKALELGDDKYLIWRQILEVNAQKKDYQSMFDEANKALDLFPIQAELYWYKGVAAMQLKKNDEAIDALQSGVELVQGNNALKAEFHSYLGDLYNTKKEYEQSDKNYDKSLELDPKNFFVLNNYSYYLSLRKEKLDKAAEMSKLSNELSPDNASFEDTYGWILYEQNKYDEALEWLHKAEHHGGENNGTILEHIGDAYFRNGNVELALEYWKKAKASGNEASDKIELKIQRKQIIE